MRTRTQFTTILTAMLLAVSFLNAAPKKGSALKYMKKKFVRSRALRVKGKTIRATMKIYYPVLKKGAGYTAIRNINRIIRNKVLTPVPSVKNTSRPANTTILFNRFFKAFRKYTREAEHPISWNLTRTIALRKGANDVITVTENWYAFTGGAHPNSRTEHYNFHTSGKRLLLRNIVAKGKLTKLHVLGERYFRRARNINPGKPFGKLGLWMKQFKLNDNFRFAKRGLIFRFNSYDIAPYAYGPTSFTIPWSALRPYLKKQFRKRSR